MTRSITLSDASADDPDATTAVEGPAAPDVGGSARPDDAVAPDDDVDDFARLVARIGYTFRDPALLRQALRHRSWCAEHGVSASNERLEFLGDAVLGLAVTDHTFHTYGDLPEGSMAKVRAAVVSAVSLADLARELELGTYLLLGRGEESTGGREKPSILSDAMEAVLGAVYVDGGWESARRLVVSHLEERIASAVDGPGILDFKTRLQELAARAFEGAPIYRVTEEGPDHDKRFSAVVVVDGVVVGAGEGRSKKQAQQAAAKRAWEHLVDHTADDTSDDVAGRTADTNGAIAGDAADPFIVKEHEVDRASSAAGRMQGAGGDA